MITTPTVGRKVWYWPVNEGMSLNHGEPAQPCDATVVYVWGDTCVNLRVTDHMGHPHTRTSVFLHQGGVEDRPPSSCATWMPYQKQQAEKAAAALSAG